MLRKEAHELLSSHRGINFVGNVEGRDIMTTEVDVVVTDGFTGNVALKSLEGALKTVVKSLFAAIGRPEYKVHADALMPAFLDLYSQFDPDSTGGAMLLGLNGVCIISHGSSSARAMVNGIKVACDMVQGDIVEKIRAAVA
jgi:glycerol-3-phosphate acyltransferase PlsX